MLLSARISYIMLHCTSQSYPMLGHNTLHNATQHYAKLRYHIQCKAKLHYAIPHKAMLSFSVLG